MTHDRQRQGGLSGSCKCWFGTLMLTSQTVKSVVLKLSERDAVLGRVGVHVQRRLPHCGNLLRRQLARAPLDLHGGTARRRSARGWPTLPPRRRQGTRGSPREALLQFLLGKSASREQRPRTCDSLHVAVTAPSCSAFRFLLVTTPVCRRCGRAASQSAPRRLRGESGICP